MHGQSCLLWDRLGIIWVLIKGLLGSISVYIYIYIYIYVRFFDGGLCVLLPFEIQVGRWVGPNRKQNLTQTRVQIVRESF